MKKIIKVLFSLILFCVISCGTIAFAGKPINTYTSYKDFTKSHQSLILDLVPSKKQYVLQHKMETVYPDTENKAKQMEALGPEYFSGELYFLEAPRKDDGVYVSFNEDSLLDAVVIEISKNRNKAVMFTRDEILLSVFSLSLQPASSINYNVLDDIIVGTKSYVDVDCNFIDGDRKVDKINIRIKNISNQNSDYYRVAIFIPQDTSITEASNNDGENDNYKSLHTVNKQDENRAQLVIVKNKRTDSSKQDASDRTKEKKIGHKDDASNNEISNKECTIKKTDQETNFSPVVNDSDVYEIHPIEVETGEMILPGLGLYLPSVEHNPFVELHIGDIGAALFNAGGMDYSSKWYSFNSIGEKDVLLTVKKIRSHHALGSGEFSYFTVVDLNRNQTDPILISKKRMPRIVYYKGRQKNTINISDICYFYNWGCSAIIDSDIFDEAFLADRVYFEVYRTKSKKYSRIELPRKVLDQWQQILKADLRKLKRARLEQTD